MKLFVVLLLVAVTIIGADKVQEKWDKMHKLCQSDPNLFVPEIIFERLKNNDHPLLPKNFALHANCMLKLLSLQNENGSINAAELRKVVERESTPEKVNEIINLCNKSDSDKEENALMLFRCLSTHKINIGQL